ncbi:MAG: hypothetical protein M1828_006677 [Chrysothrix sp. TS-e1954]|nr:MAG: hypothetical protein M1828_006677 [Chrysothrix sp. TS-e1954]
MRLYDTLALSYALATALTSPVSAAIVTSRAEKPGLSPAFTATLGLGKPLKPIPIAGGELLIEPITNGTITGSAFNGRISGGVAYPDFYNNMKTEEPDILVYGTSDEGDAFLAILSGVGSSTKQLSRVTVQAGGSYASLNETFIVGEILRGSGSSVTVEGYIVK